MSEFAGEEWRALSATLAFFAPLFIVVHTWWCWTSPDSLGEAVDVWKPVNERMGEAEDALNEYLRQLGKASKANEDLKEVIK